jgi:hypothetical protein
MLRLAGVIFSRNLLQLDDLLVNKKRAIVNKLEGVLVATLRTINRFLNATTLNLDFLLKSQI